MDIVDVPSDSRLRFRDGRRGFGVRRQCSSRSDEMGYEAVQLEYRRYRIGILYHFVSRVYQQLLAFDRKNS